jgi:hypothetical protein
MRSDARKRNAPGTYVVALPWSRPPLTQNRSSRADNPYVKARRVREARAEAVVAIRAAGLPFMSGANVVLHYRPATRHRRDSDGTCATLKVVLDSLVAEGVLHDDSWVEVPFSGHHIHRPNGEPAAMWLTLTDPDKETP